MSNSTKSDSSVIIKYNNQVEEFIRTSLDILNDKNKKHICIGLDFEFDRDFKTNTHVMSLAQLMISYVEDETTHRTKVYLMDLRIFPKNHLNTFVNSILLNKRALKILHGSESLDLPALYDLIKSDEKFKLFLSTMVDTRQLCETYNILSNKYLNTSYRKCNIYSALLNTQLISANTYQELSSIKINYNKPWNIHKLTQKQITYAAADVLFLHNLYIEYHRLLGNDMIKFVMNAFRYAVMSRMELINIKFKNRPTRDLMDKLDKMNVLQYIQAESPIGKLSIEDLFKIEYSKKAMVRLTYETYS